MAEKMDIKNKRIVDTRYLHDFAALYQGFRVQEVDDLTERRAINDLVGLGFERDVAKALSKAYAGQLREIIGSLKAFTEIIVGDDVNIVVSFLGTNHIARPEVYVQVQPEGPFEVKLGVHIGYLGKAVEGFETPEKVMELLLDDDPVDADTVVIEAFRPRPDSFFHPNTFEKIKEHVAKRGEGRTNNFSLSNAPGGGKVVSISSSDIVIQDDLYFIFVHRFSFDPTSVTVKNKEVLENVVVQLK